MAEPDTASPSLHQGPARPYRVPLISNAPPESVIAGLPSTDQPGVLWGDWFGGGVFIMVRPLVEHTPGSADEGFAALDEQPTIADRPPRFPDLVGGGWLACLGYAPGTTGLAFYDSLLRWRPAEGWSFESLGLAGRDAANTAALAYWTARLDDALPAGPDQTDGLVAAPFVSREPARLTRDRYLAAVEQVIGRIHWGEFYQLNLCIRLHARAGRPAPVIFAGAAAQLEPAYGALASGPEADAGRRMVASFSPELFLRVRGREVVTAPIKGTAPRRPDGSTAAGLQASAKDAAENIMIVDLMRNDLSRVCRPGSVSVSELLAVQPHPGVWHLVSTVRGELTEGVTTSSLLAATFPPGSVTGAPKLAAQAGIAEIEAESRGAYTGSVGLVSPVAGTELNVLIRTFELTGDALALGVGGGITVDSVPIREWYECLHKAAPLVRAARSSLGADLVDEPGPPDPALSGAGVFESILVVRGHILRLAGHLARLDRSCRELYGFGLPDDLAATVLDRLPGVPAADRLAVRVTAQPRHHRLQIGVEVHPLGPRRTVSALKLARRPDRTWRHKWLDRAALIAAEHASDPALPYFAEAGRVTETSRGNLFWRDDEGAWCTPPLDEQVLPGVTRREVIDLLDRSGTPVRIRPGRPADLYRASGVFWTSSLSGAVAITAIDDQSLPVDPEFVVELNRRLGTEPGD